MLRYAITESKRFGETLSERRGGLLAQAERLSNAGIDYLQLREKDLNAGDLFQLAEELSLFLKSAGRTKLLINSRADVAVAANADGVHLTSLPDEVTPEQVRQIFTIAGSPPPVVSVSCHAVEEVEQARADIILLGPIFEKRVRDELVVAGIGLDALQHACQIAGDVPVLALGGIEDTNLHLCLDRGAAGIAGIRLFH